MEPYEQLRAAVRRACTSGHGFTAAEAAVALTYLRMLREELAEWEPLLIAAARERGISWAELAPVLGVASRQAAERRYLRVRAAEPGAASTAEQRVQDERDRRASDRAVGEWARRHAATLRQLAGQVGALSGLNVVAAWHVGQVRQALGGDDVTALLPPLTGVVVYLQPTHPELAAQIAAVAEFAARIRRETQFIRRGSRDSPAG